MDIVYTVCAIVVFLAPGFCIKFVRNFITVFPKEDDIGGTVYEKLSGIAFESTIVSSLTVMLVIYTSNNMQVKTFSDLLYNMNSFKFLGNYIFYMLIVSASWLFVRGITETMRHKIHNWITERAEGLIIEYPDRKTVLQGMFSEKAKLKESAVVAIYKGDIRIVAGILHRISNGASTLGAWGINRVDEVEKVLEADESRAVKDRWLNYIEQAIYFPETGVLMRIYDSENIMKHWDEIDLS